MHFTKIEYLTHLRVRVHEHLGKNISDSLQFWTCESIPILEVILQANQSLFAVCPVRAGTVSNDVSNVLNIQTHNVTTLIHQIQSVTADQVNNETQWASTLHY
jgi:hypothetical protein